MLSKRPAGFGRPFVRTYTYTGPGHNGHRMRAGPLLLLPVVFLLFASGCKNSLDYAAPGGALDCSDPGAICGAGGYRDIGDGGPAISASLVEPTALARDAAGNLFIADRAQNRIRRIDAATGEISTVAGTGEESYAFVPGLPADETLVASPISVAVTDDGTVFWSDERSCAIYAVSPTSGTVSLAAGSRCSGDTSGIEPGDVLFDFNDCSRLRARGNDLIIASTQRSEIRYWNRGSASTVVAGITVQPGTVPSVAGVLNPCDAAVTAVGGLLAIEAEYQDCRLRHISETGVTTFLVGSGTSESSDCGSGGDGGAFTAAQLDYPSGIVLDEDAELAFVTDDSFRVRVLNLGGSNSSFGGMALGTSGIATIAGQTSTEWLTVDGGSGITQHFGGAPRQPVLDGEGNVLIADPVNNVIRRISAADGTMSVIAGFADAGVVEGFVNAPSSIALMPGGDLLIAGRSARVFRQSGSGRELFAGTGDPTSIGDGEAATSAGLWATGVATDENGRTFVADSRNHRIRVIDAASGTISTLAGNGSGGSGGDGGPAINASFDGPHSALVDSSGNLFIADEDRIRYVNLGTSPITIAGVTILPQNIETIAGGNGNGYAGDGVPAKTAAMNMNQYGSDYANGMAIDGRTLYFADTLNNRIRKVDLTTGIISTAVGSGASGSDAIGKPVGIAVHGGWIYWTQLDGNFVKRMQLSSGVIEVIAGDGNTGYFGEGVHASQSQLIAPQGLAISGNGTIYVTDASHRVRRISP